MASRWQLFALCLKVEVDFIQLIEEACLESFGRFYGHESFKLCLYNVLEAWLCEDEGTGDLPRTWDTIVTVLESCRIPTLAESLRKQTRFSKHYYCKIEHVSTASALELMVTCLDCWICTSNIGMLTVLILHTLE